MQAHGQVDGRRHQARHVGNHDRWEATIADPTFWMWLQGHALTASHAASAPVAETYRALSNVAGDLLGHRARAIRAEMAAVQPPHGNAKPR